MSWHHERQIVTMRSSVPSNAEMSDVRSVSSPPNDHAVTIRPFKHCSAYAISRWQQRRRKKCGNRGSGTKSRVWGTKVPQCSSRGICRRRVSGVRVSITRQYCVKTAKHRITQTTPHNSPKTLVFWSQRSRRNSKGITYNSGAKCTWSRLK